MGKECGAWVSRRLWGGSNTSPLKTTAWEAMEMDARWSCGGIPPSMRIFTVLLFSMLHAHFTTPNTL